MTISNCDSQNVLRIEDIYSPQWLVLCVVKHVVYNIAFKTTDVASKILTSLNANYSNSSLQGD